jgi:hypothetical protein
MTKSSSGLLVQDAGSAVDAHWRLDLAGSSRLSGQHLTSSWPSWNVRTSAMLKSSCIRTSSCNVWSTITAPMR